LKEGVEVKTYCENVSRCLKDFELELTEESDTIKVLARGDDGVADMFSY
jgi:hypothetical protein